MTCAAWAAEPFVSFDQTTGSWLLNDVTIGYAAKEHSCVQLAAANLQKDFETVTGSKPAVSETKPVRRVKRWLIHPRTAGAIDPNRNAQHPAMPVHAERNRGTTTSNIAG